MKRSRLPIRPISSPWILTVVLASMLCLPAAASAAETSPRTAPDTSAPGNGGELTLQRAYRLALEHNENVDVSREEVRSARQNTRIARSELLAKLSVSGQYFRQKEITQFRTTFPTEEANYHAELRQPIFQGGKGWTGWNQLEQEEEASRFRHHRRQQEILFQVARRYYDVLLAQKNVDIARQNLQRANQQLALARGRREVGTATRTAVLRARVQVAEAEEQLEQARNDRGVRREQLALELGLKRLPASPAEPDRRATPDTGLKTFQDRALNHRRDVQQARAQVGAAEYARSVERADYLPRLDLVGTYDYFPQNVRFHGTEEDWRVTLQASYSLFTGLRDDAELKRSRSRLRQARSNLERLKREVRVEVRSAYLDVQSQKRVLQSVRDRVAFARSNYDQVTAQFREGSASSVDVVDAVTALNEAESRLAVASVTLQLQILRLRLATGTFQQDLLSAETA